MSRESRVPHRGKFQSDAHQVCLPGRNSKLSPNKETNHRSRYNLLHGCTIRCSFRSVLQFPTKNRLARPDVADTLVNKATYSRSSTEGAPGIPYSRLRRWVHTGKMRYAGAQRRGLEFARQTICVQNATVLQVAIYTTSAKVCDVLMGQRLSWFAWGFVEGSRLKSAVQLWPFSGFQGQEARKPLPPNLGPKWRYALGSSQPSRHMPLLYLTSMWFIFQSNPASSLYLSEL